jgi:hypothetical protein
VASSISQILICGLQGLENAMPTDNEGKLLAVLEKLFPMGTTLRFLETTEPDHQGGEFNRIRIDYAKDSINLRIPRAFVEVYEDSPAQHKIELEERLSRFVADKLATFGPNPGPRLRPVILWTLEADAPAAGAKVG